MSFPFVAFSMISEIASLQRQGEDEMHVLLISLFLLIHPFALDSSPGILNNVRQAVWTKSNEIIIVDGAPMEMTERVLRYDIDTGKLHPVYNGKFRKKGVLCFVSSDGKMIASNNLKTYEMIVTDLVKKKIRFKENLKDMIVRGGYSEIITIRDVGGRDIEYLGAYPCFLSDEKLIFVLVDKGLCGSYCSHVVTVWYNNGSLSTAEIQENSRGPIPPIRPVSDTSQKNCIVFINRYFNLAKGKVLDVFEKKIEEEIREDKGEGCGAIFGNYLYFTLKGYLWSYDINRKKLEKLPISPSTVKKISSLYVTEKYIYALMKTTENKAHGQLYRNGDFKALKCPRLEGLVKEGYEIIHYSRAPFCDRGIVFSPDGGRIMIYDREKKKVWLEKLQVSF